jgi:hypothetical protein
MNPRLMQTQMQMQMQMQAIDVTVDHRAGRVDNAEGLACASEARFT